MTMWIYYRGNQPKQSVDSVRDGCNTGRCVTWPDRERNRGARNDPEDAINGACRSTGARPRDYGWRGMPETVKGVLLVAKSAFTTR
jgi:hypothetical protein